MKNNFFYIIIVVIKLTSIKKPNNKQVLLDCLKEFSRLIIRAKNNICLFRSIFLYNYWLICNYFLNPLPKLAHFFFFCSALSDVYIENGVCLSNSYRTGYNKICL